LTEDGLRIIRNVSK